MSIARGIAKAAKAQARGLQGKRNSQGDFMPEEVQMKGVQDAVAPDLQNHIEAVYKEWEELQIQGMEISQEKGMGMSPEDIKSTNKLLDSLEVRQDELIDDLITKLEEEGVEVPFEIRELQNNPTGATYSPDENNYQPYSQSAPGDEAREAWTEMGGDRL